MTALNFLNFIQYLFLIYSGFYAVYLLFYAIASFFYKYGGKTSTNRLRKFLILIPAYKEDKIIINTATEALKQDYPSDLYDVYVIADSFKRETIELLQNEDNIQCIEVSFKLSTKARSINKALQAITEEYDGVIILDADNIMDDDLILKVNNAMANGSKAIQCHRVAKNQDTSFAILDALSEEINNTIFRKGHIALGISSALIGSGMAFEYKLYRSIMKTIDTYADEDKELEIKLFLNRIKIDFLNDVYVYDEKVTNSKVFVKQRSRWISSQIFYARTYIFKSIYELFKHSNFDFFDKMLQLLLAPRILMLGITFIIAVLSSFFNRGFLFYSWLVVFLAFVLALVISVPKRFYNKQTLLALLSLPYGFLMMALALFKIKLGHNRLSPTPHHTANHTKNERIRERIKNL
ncbi:MAG: glycosyltransferase [Bacteroidetes bacterium]|nr:glycosyltransferase [Bacteroidota bacterium]